MAEPVPFRARGFAPVNHPLAGAATLIGIILLWQAGAMAGWIDTRFLPPPLAIGQALVNLLRSGELWSNLSASLRRLALGWTVGTVAGIAVGFAVGLSTLARSPGLSVVSALFPIPKIALVPLLLIWLGIGEGSKIAIIIYTSLFTVFMNTMAGAATV